MEQDSDLRCATLGALCDAGSVQAVVWAIRPKTESRPAVCEVFLVTLRCSAASGSPVEHLKVTAVQLLRVRFCLGLCARVHIQYYSPKYQMFARKSFMGPAKHGRFRYLFRVVWVGLDRARLDWASIEEAVPVATHIYVCLR